MLKFIPYRKKHEVFCNLLQYTVLYSTPEDKQQARHFEASTLHTEGAEEGIPEAELYQIISELLPLCILGEISSSVLINTDKLGSELQTKFKEKRVTNSSNCLNRFRCLDKFCLVVA